MSRTLSSTNKKAETNTSPIPTSAGCVLRWNYPLRSPRVSPPIGVSGVRSGVPARTLSTALPLGSGLNSPPIGLKRTQEAAQVHESSSKRRRIRSIYNDVDSAALLGISCLIMPSHTGRTALLAVDHPLCYSRKTADCSLSRDGAWIGSSQQDASNIPFSLEMKLQRVLDRQDIVNLLNEYAYVLDTVMVDPTYANKWADLFTADCSVTYPFGHYRGRDALPAMCLDAETRFQRMIVSDCHICKHPIG